MAEQIGWAVVSEVVDRSISSFTGKCNDHKSIDEKVYRLEMLLIKIKSAVQVSEEFDIYIEPLKEWKAKLKEAVSKATEVLCKFKTNQTVEGEPSSHDPPMQVPQQANSILVQTASSPREAATHQVDNEADKTLCDNKVGAPYEKANEAVEGVSSSLDPSIDEEGEYNSTLVDPATTTLQVDKQAAKVFGKLNCSYPHEKAHRTVVEGGSSSHDPSTKRREEDGEPRLEILCPENSPSIKKRVFECTRVLDPRTVRRLPSPLMMLNKYRENGENIRMLMKTVEKLEKVGADIGDFIELLKMQQSFIKRRRVRSCSPSWALDEEAERPRKRVRRDHLYLQNRIYTSIPCR